MNKLSASINRWLSLLGTAGVIALGLLVFAVLFHNMAVAPSRARLAEVKARIVQVQSRLPRPGVSASAGPQDALARVDAYYGSFPGLDELAAAINDTLEVAKGHALVINQADYQYEPPRKGELTAYQMSFAVKGSYPRIRRFLMDLLNDHPEMALEQVTLRRDNVGSAELEARVQLTFYVTGLPWNRQSAVAG